MTKINDKNHLVKNLVLLSCQMVFLELIWKIYHHEKEFWLNGCYIFVVVYVLCIGSEFCGLKDNEIVKSTTFKTVLTWMHGMDGFAAFLIGLGMLTHNIVIFLVGVIIITKCCLIHLMNRLILAHKKAEVRTFFDGFTQTSKSFLHHVASFLFLTHPHEIVLTTLWRTISMSGHALLVLRGGRVSSSTLSMISWVLAYVRNVFVFFLLCLCIVEPMIRSQFARSAVGHIAYMAVRIGPVFQQGGANMNTVDKEEWIALSGMERVHVLMSGRHLMLGVELTLLAVLSSYLAVLRVHVLMCDVNQLQYYSLDQLYSIGSRGDGGFMSVVSSILRTSSDGLRGAN